MNVLFITASSIIIFILLIIVAIYFLINNHICDLQSCKPFIDAFKHKTRKKQLLYILDNMTEDGLLPFAFITSAIICLLFFAIISVELTIINFTLTFLLSFIIFYLIVNFFIHCYIKPIKKHISNYIEKYILD